MTKIIGKIEKIFEDIAYAESGEYGPLHKKEGHDSLEDILTAIGMAEGGNEEYAKNLHSLFHKGRSRN